MEFFLIILLFVVGYWIYQSVSKKTLPPDELSLALNTPHPQLSNHQKQLLLTLFTSYISDDYSVEKRFEEFTAFKSDKNKSLIEKVERVHKMYIQLNERYKNSSIDVRWEIVDDWSDYLNAVNTVDFYTMSGKFIDSHKKSDGAKLSREKVDNGLEKTKIKIEEIERRFDGKLSKKISESPF